MTACASAPSCALRNSPGNARQPRRWRRSARSMTQDELRIENGEIQINRLEILDLSGKVVCQYDDSKNKINISALSRGIYFVKIETDNGVVIRKFVKE